MLIVYQFFIGLFFALSFPFLLLYVLISGHHRRGLKERLGLYRLAEPAVPSSPRIWIHAASIGEIKAAGIIIEQLRSRDPDSFFILTTMTIHGRDFARSRLTGNICCYLAPLDLPVLTDLVVKRLNPSVYVCLETELWPLLIHKIKKKGAAAVLVNGRISDRSIHRYLKLRFLFARVLRDFDWIGAISNKDKVRFVDLGAQADRIMVTGNIKHDTALPGDPEAVMNHWRTLLSVGAETRIFIAGSTHHPEEESLLPLIERGIEGGQIWLLAPRHLDRVGQIREQLDRRTIRFDLLSECTHGKERSSSLVIVDTFGDLSRLFSLASAVFLGGSLVDYGGHNLLEVAIWNKAVIFGPYMQDFQDIADELEQAGAGFRINSVIELEQLLQRFADDPALLEQAGSTGGSIARGKQGAAELQTGLVLQALSGRKR